MAQHQVGQYDPSHELAHANVSDYGNLVNYNVVGGSRVAFQAPIAKLADRGSQRAGLHRPVIVHHGVNMGGSGLNSRYLTRALVVPGFRQADPNYHNMSAAYGSA